MKLSDLGGLPHRAKARTRQMNLWCFLCLCAFSNLADPFKSLRFINISLLEFFLFFFFFLRIFPRNTAADRREEMEQIDYCRLHVRIQLKCADKKTHKVLLDGGGGERSDRLTGIKCTWASVQVQSGVMSCGKVESKRWKWGTSACWANVPTQTDCRWLALRQLSVCLGLELIRLGGVETLPPLLCLPDSNKSIRSSLVNQSYFLDKTYDFKSFPFLLWICYVYFVNWYLTFICL